MISRGCIPHNLNDPVIFGISDSGVAIARNFPISLSNRSGNLVRVKVTAGLSMNETNSVLVAGITELLFRLIFHFATVGIEEPVVVGIFVVVAGDLLLSGTLWVNMVMGVK